MRALSDERVDAGREAGGAGVGVGVVGRAPEGVGGDGAGEGEEDGAEVGERWGGVV